MSKELKVVIDTNIFVSILIAKGKTLSKIYEFFLKAKFTPIFSFSSYLELTEVIRRKKFKRYFKEEDVERLKELLKTDAIFVFPSTKVNICQDAKDNMILEAALEANADFIVTGDDDLLTIPSKDFPIPIITPKRFLEILVSQ